MPWDNMLTILRRDVRIEPINSGKLDSWSLQWPIKDREPWKSFLKDDGEFYAVQITRGYFTNYARGEMVDDRPIPSDLTNSWDLYFENHDADLGIKAAGRRNVSIGLWHVRGSDAEINTDPGNTVSWGRTEEKLVELIRN